MAQTEKNKIYYNNDENSIADVLSDMKQLAESTDKALEDRVKKVEGKDLSANDFTDEDKAKLDGLENYDDTELQAELTALRAENKSLYSQIPSGKESGNSIHLSDSSNLDLKVAVNGGHSQEVRSGKNKLKLPPTTSNGLTSTINENGSIRFNGTLTSTWANLSSTFTKDLAAGVYTFSTDKVLSNYRIILKVRFEDLTFYDYIIENAKSKTFTTTQKIINYYAYVAGQVDQVLDETLFVQLEQGSTDTEFEPYGAMPSPEFPSEVETVSGSVEVKVQNEDETETQTAIVPVQQEMLEGDKIEDKEYHNWGKKILDGTENNWEEYGSSGLGIKLANFFPIAQKYSSSELSDIICSHYTSVARTKIYEGSEMGVAVSENEMYFSYKGVDNFKSFLSEQYANGTPVTVYYKLATPTELELTEEQKEALNSLHTYKNVTNISVDNELATLDVTYKKDLETLFSRKEDKQ